MATIPAKHSEIFQKLLGLRSVSERQLIQAIESQLPLETLARLKKHGVSSGEVYALIINPRTLKHRRSKKQPLSKEESERAIRVGRVLATAEAVWGGEEAALNWLRTPKGRFDGRTPMEMLSTETGGRMVEEMLLQIDEGMFA
ncbi:MAG TPA: antitoxin Xre/MbcA/ParS toxin-binding domain-containing protein [Terriglobales bacterium]|nr:antitoxin Xre/MbcA/ParS toxin-binding domain-containing protein [Terriglobales bacterium]